MLQTVKVTSSLRSVAPVQEAFATASCSHSTPPSTLTQKKKKMYQSLARPILLDKKKENGIVRRSQCIVYEQRRDFSIPNLCLPLFTKLSTVRFSALLYKWECSVWSPVPLVAQCACTLY